MEFKIENIEDNSNKNTYRIDIKPVSKKEIKEAHLSGKIFVISSEFLNINQKIYGTNKAETVKIQKENSKKVIKVYKSICKVVNALKSKKLNFNGVFYVENLNERKNNNVFLVLSLLNLKYNTCFFSRLSKSILYTCEYLDKENALHNMCDFHDNKCAKHRARGFERSTGCCPSSCKFMDNCPCKTKNLSCKIIMCDYLIEQGYFFTPHTIPILTRHMTFIERVASTGMFFKSTKRTFRFMRIVRFLLCFAIFLAGYTIVSLFI